MKISIFQTRPLYRKREENEKNINGLIEASDADILLFPEMALTGYYFTDKKELRPLCYGKDSDFLRSLKDLCVTRKKCVTLGFPEIQGDNLYNSCIIVFPDGTSHIYRKSHLFYKESLVFDKGNTGFNVYRHPHADLNIGLMICYDWRFPEAARTLALKGADLILCPSNLVTGVWFDAMRTRALENKVYLAVANRTGEESNEGETLRFNGRSAFFDFNGHALAEAPAEDPVEITCEFDPLLTRDKSFNPYNDIFADRRAGLYFK